MYPLGFTLALQWQAAAIKTARLTVSAAVVMQLRMVQMSLGVMKPDEAMRMVFEKPAAFMRAGEVAARTLARNQGVAEAALAATSQVFSTVRANEARLLRQTTGRRRK